MVVNVKYPGVDIGKTFPENQNGLSASFVDWTCRANQLWNIFFPGISAFVKKKEERKQHLHFLHYIVTDGWDIQGLFTVNHDHRKHNINNFSSSNYRRLITPQNPRPLLISDFTAERRPYQGATNSNTFHGSGNFDFMIQNMMLQQGPEAVSDSLQHPWIVLDPGIINAIGGSVVMGELICDQNNKPVGLRIRFTRFLFRNKGRYTPVQFIIDEQSERIQTFQDDLVEMSKHHPRTMDSAEYLKYADVFRECSEPLKLSNRDKKALINGQKLKVCAG